MMRTLPRKAAAIIALVLVMASSAAPAGCRRAATPAETGVPTIAAVEELLAQSKSDEAVKLAENLVAKNPDDPKAKHILAMALVAAADGIVVTDDETGRVKAAYYYEAIANDPGLPGIYTGLCALAETGRPSSDYPPQQDLLGVAPKAVAAWQKAVEANPVLSKDEAVVAAVAKMAAMAGEPVLAADLRQDWFDAQMAAALNLIAYGEPDRARTYYDRAAKIDGGRTDVLVLGSLIGVRVPEVTVEQVLDLALPERTRPGQIVARAGTVFFSVENDGTPGSAIYRAIVDSRAASPVTPPPAAEKVAEAGGPWFDVTADGSALAFGVGDGWGKTWEVAALDLGTGARTVLAQSKGPIRGLAWSPDARYLAFASQTGLYLVRSDGTGLRRLLEAKAAASEFGSVPAWPEWFSDGRRLLFGEVLYEGCGGTFVCDTATGEITEIHRAETANAHPSPDGRRVVLNTTVYGASEESRAKIVELESGAAKALVTGRTTAYSGGWSADGRSALLILRLAGYDQAMTLQRPGDLRLWTYDAQSGALRRLAVRADLTVWPQGLEWAADGTIYAFVSPSSEPLSGYRLIGLRPEAR